MIILNFWDVYDDIQTSGFKAKERIVLTRQLIALTLIFLIIWKEIAGLRFFLIESVMSKFLLFTLPFLYIATTAISNRVLIKMFRGQRKPIRGAWAIGIGLIILVVAAGFLLYGVLLYR